MIPKDVLKEAKNLEFYVRIWKSYYFYIMYDLHKFFRKTELDDLKFSFPKPSQLINDVLIIVVNYHDDIDNRLQFDAFKVAMAAFDEQFDIAAYMPGMGLKTFNAESYFKQVIKPHLYDNELIDQFLVHDSKTYQFPKKMINKILHDMHKNPEDYFAWETPVHNSYITLDQYS